jgi:hypothetical protein
VIRTHRRFDATEPQDGSTHGNVHQTRHIGESVKPSCGLTQGLFKVALYKDASKLAKHESTAFDEKLKPGTVVSNSGIYRCSNCGDEIAANKGNPLPPQNHHQHKPPAPILWQLLVCAVQKK